MYMHIYMYMHICICIYIYSYLVCYRKLVCYPVYWNCKFKPQFSKCLTILYNYKFE